MEKQRGIPTIKSFFLIRLVGIGRAFLKEKIVALFDIIKYFSFIKCLFLSYIGIFITSAAEHIFVVIDVENADWTEIVAGLALKFLFINNFGGQDLINIVGSLRQKAFFNFCLARMPTPKQPMSSGSGGTRIFFIEQHGKSQRHSFIFGYSSLQNNIVTDGPVADNSDLDNWKQ